MHPLIAEVALPVPLNKTFDYLIQDQIPIVGGRVKVPFGRQNKIGVVLAIKEDSKFALNKLKQISQVLDTTPLWTDVLFKLLLWACRYYQYPIGDALNIAMPSHLRQGHIAAREAITYWQLTELGVVQSTQEMSRAPKQLKALSLLKNKAIAHQTLLQEEIPSSCIKTLEQKGWIQAIQKIHTVDWLNTFEITEEKPRLNTEQAICLASINSSKGFDTYMLEGITGSGKTEVYLNAIEPILAKGQQALVLVPEIGLTPQTINRFKQRFNVLVSVIHSGLNDTERMNSWLDAKNNQAAIIIGTRSAVFSPCQSLGIIIVDEEHDISYKQQDTFRYHARDLAVMRAHFENIPIILGSATPSFESLHNALSGKYHHLELSQRAGGAIKPANEILDIRGVYHESGISAPLIAQMQQHLAENNQVMLFLNRRGYSPILMCHDCGWFSECKRCDRYYTLHGQARELRCHHCGSQKKMPMTCRECHSPNLIGMGLGTEQVEQEIQRLFPQYSCVRIDRDNTRRKGSLDAMLNAIQKNQHQILIGTQMLAKGHHFPNVTLVAILDVDSALFSNDFRSSERLAQLFIQVSGRAGRASKPGKVILQTHHSNHPLLHTLVHHGYKPFSSDGLKERKSMGLPPFSFLALFRGEANRSEDVEQFLHQLKMTLENNPFFDSEKKIIGPSPSPMPKRAGKYRWQLVFQTKDRRSLQQMLTISLPAIQQVPLAKKVRWSVDIEPQDMS